MRRKPMPVRPCPARPCPAHPQPAPPRPLPAVAWLAHRAKSRRPPRSTRRSPTRKNKSHVSHEKAGLEPAFLFRKLGEGRLQRETVEGFPLFVVAPRPEPSGERRYAISRQSRPWLWVA